MREKFVSIVSGNQGQITVFLSLIFMILMGVGFCILEGINLYMKDSLAEEAFIEAGNEILTNYHRQLFEKYHIFFMDPEEKTQIVEDGKKYINQYLDKNSCFSFQCRELSVTEEKTAVDEDGLYLKHQIREWMKYRELEKAGAAINKLFESTSSVEQRKGSVQNEIGIVGEEIEQETMETGDNEDTRNNASPTLDGREGIRWNELKQVLQQICHSGILFYVIDDSGQISDLTMEEHDLPSKKKGIGKEKNIDFLFSFSDLRTWKNVLGNIDISKPDARLLSDDYFMAEYVFEHFGGYGRKNKTSQTALQYEIEYLIGGRESDRDNLKLVANRILLLRFLMNYGCASNNHEINAVAGTMADALSGVLGLPVAREAVRILLIASVSYGESLLDVHTLFSGGKIPALKDDSTWNLYFHNAAELLRKKERVKTGKINVGYEDYLKLLLSMKKQVNSLEYRMMDLMQVNLCLEQPDFLMEKCLFRFRWQGMMAYPASSFMAALQGYKGNSGVLVTLDRVNSY